MVDQMHASASDQWNGRFELEWSLKVMWYDIFVAGILIYFAIRGAVKGVVWQIAGIAGIVLCFAFADAISAAAGPYVKLEPPLNNWVVLFASYLIFSFVCFGIARSISTWIEKNQMKEFDRHLGAVFGLLKGAVLCLIMTFLIVTVSQSAREALKYSYSGKAAAIIMDRLHPIMPEKLHDALSEYIHLLDYDDLPLTHDHDHDHGNAGEVIPTPGRPGSGIQLGNSSQLPTPTQPTGSGFWTQVQNTVSSEAQRVIADAIRRAAVTEDRTRIEQEVLKMITTSDSAERLQLQQQIVQAGSVRLEQYLLQQLSGQHQSEPTTTIPDATPSPTEVVGPPPMTSPTPSGSDQEVQLAREIAAVYSTIPTIRLGIEQQILRSVDGIPDSLRLAVLTDWKADLWKDQPDPEPQTGANSTVDQRIVFQMARQGVALGQLSPDVQRRLQQAQAPQQGSSL